ncbi:hypothetical protein [Rossellomorea sp. DA94]|uniref:hypothetical protein n=1 Tax=Rossellomorea sp. DA94 TaxID=3038653 RepID=UPI0024490D97|nr:hypothetical protein [Rossellomorea sp. DA94]WGG45464.1 hypothetical protein P8596_22610 [Rossellomorea sp. DA94]
MIKDPLRNLKNELEKELFQNIEMPSQKQAILTKIQKQKYKKRRNWRMILNVGIVAAIIFIVSVLGSSYLPKDELVENDHLNETKEPQDDKGHSAFIPEDALKEKIEKEKRTLQDKKRQSPVREESPDTEDVDTQGQEKEEEKEAVGEFIIDPPTFDFSVIIQNPEEFKEKASKGILYGTDTKLGDTYDSIKERYGKLPATGGYEGGYRYFLGDDYVLSFRERQGGTLYRSESRIKEKTLTVNQVINAMGDPYYFYDMMNDRVNLVYTVDGNQLLMRVEGLVDIDGTSDNSDFKVVGVDLEAEVTAVELSETWIDEKKLAKKVKFITADDLEIPFHFNENWIIEAKEKILAKQQVKNIDYKKIENDDTSYCFKITVGKDITHEKGKEIARYLIEEITTSSEKETGQKRVWDYYSYSLLVTQERNGMTKRILEGYAQNFPKKDSMDTPHQTAGSYPPEVEWVQY